MAKNNTPLEEDEQIAFVEWLELQNLKFTAIPNSTYTKYHSQKLKNYRTGLRAGLCDMFVLIPKDKSSDGAGYALFIEMKRVRGSVTSQEQHDWINSINALETPYTQAYVAKGADEAIRVVSHYLKNVDSSVF